MRKKPKKTGRRRFWRILLILLVAALLLFAYVNVSAGIVHVRRAEITLSDLPKELDGLTILYVSDLHVTGFGRRAMEKLFDELAALKPDLLLLGGDFSSTSILESGKSRTEKDNVRDLFLLSLSDFPAPSGKYAVAGNNDSDYASLERGLALGGITLLRNSGVRLSINGAMLVIAGTEDADSGVFDLTGLRKEIKDSDCVILLTHNPDRFRNISITSAGDGGHLADLVLAGHTHGGQVRLGGYTPLTNSIYGTRYLSGWVYEENTFLLTSNGVGCTVLDMRLGAEAQTHLITLRCE